MDTLHTIAEQRAWTASIRGAGDTIAFVPTMGALHAGHISLIAHAKSKAKRVIVSIFVNPTQFDNPEDLAQYPMTLEKDIELLHKAGVDALFLPTKEAMYPNGFCTFVELVGPLTDKLCAVARPGHFRGVATVVTKLFHIVQPDVAVFGQKDLQQSLIIGRLVLDLDLPIEIVIAPTLRDADGLAMSSRNRRLSPASREKALGLPRGLELARQAYEISSERSALKLSECVYNELLVHDGVEVDYCDVVSMHGFQEKENADDTCVLAAAIFVDGVRLIDHVVLAGAPIATAVDE